MLHQPRDTCAANAIQPMIQTKHASGSGQLWPSMHDFKQVQKGLFDMAH